MIAYVPMLSFAVDHRYFSRGNAAFEFVPTAASAAMLRNLDLILRPQGNGFALFCLAEDLADLRRPSDTDNGSHMLEVKVFTRDPHFARYTSPFGASRDAVLYLDSWRAQHMPDGRMRLHAEDSVSDAYFEDWNSPLIRSAVTRDDAGVRPFLIVNLSLNDGIVPSTEAPAYYADFATYSSYWKYYFLGDIAKRDLSIEDVKGKVEFTSLGMTDVASGKALAFMSSSAIPMQNAPVQQFQLLEHGAMGEKVLIKRLPNAAIGQVSRENIKQEAALVSEMYIN